ncbi:MAG: RnfABCDGE type electron transport complex subunit A [Clostridia bacterium]|nr:RnfABCDGE type electron transport complex subunit A [Clostridia bacterium]
MKEYFLIILGGLLINNFVLVKFYGICPFLGVSKKTDTALGMGMAVTFVMALASVFAYVIYEYLLVPFELTYLKTIAFILVIASLVQIVEMVIKRFSPTLYQALGVYLPLITTNCAVLGVAMLNTEAIKIGAAEVTVNLFGAFLNGAFSGLGFTLAIVLLAGVREKLARADVPKAFQGFPITLMAAAIMAMAFSAFSSLAF